MMSKLIKKTKKAFTLIEMVIVLFIISLLLLVMIPNLGAQKNNASTKSEDAFVTTMQTEIDMYDGDGVSIPTWRNLKDDGYISENQFKRASKKYYIILDKKTSAYKISLTEASAK
ncbi:competence type IV pilus major pilin ComGC [Companilactobacillus jidongensis]|uniref:competence type IV pilus major pilin ComGC n=1 Tax=Companilactobacillus jidongensis TaxID=2486006 RepID=UPI001CDB66E7|nr:competence type IV pilus major pilin ComGC [Companilactobacillus jidongensis]